MKSVSGGLNDFRAIQRVFCRFRGRYREFEERFREYRRVPGALLVVYRSLLETYQGVSVSFLGLHSILGAIQGVFWAFENLKG